MNAPGPCIVCSRHAKVPRRGMCRRCHIDDLAKRRADGPIDGRVKVPILGRLLPRINFNGPGGCWLWTGQLSNKGYGLISVAPVGKRGAHVVMWEELIGPIPEGLELDHLCVTPACVNPEHLEPVTHAENQRRIQDRQTHCKRAGHPYDAANTYWDPRGHRRCRECQREAYWRRPPQRRAA